VGAEDGEVAGCVCCKEVGVSMMYARGLEAQSTYLCIYEFGKSANELRSSVQIVVETFFVDELAD
jgi:hypothetical protein